MMAQLGTATLKVEADTRDAMRKIRSLNRAAARGTLSWPRVVSYIGTLAFLSFVIEKAF